MQVIAAAICKLVFFCVTRRRDAAFQLWLTALKLAASPPPPEPSSFSPLLTKTSSFDDMIGPPSPFTTVSLGGGSTEELVEDVAAAATDVSLPFDVAPGLQPDACVAISNSGRITAWAVDTWPAGDV